MYNAWVVEALGRAFDEFDAGVGVQIVQPRHDGPSPGMNGLLAAIAAPDVLAFSDGSDFAASNRDCPVVDDPAFRVHCHNRAAVDQDVDELRPVTLGHLCHSSLPSIS
jgi:hypothetical protein